MIELPRVEAEFNYNGKFGENNNAKIFLNGAAQTAKDGVTGTTNSLSSTGVGGGMTHRLLRLRAHRLGLLRQGHGLAVHG